MKILLFLTFIALLALISCNVFNGDSQNVEYFKVKIDQSVSEDTIAIGDIIVFTLEGLIGGNGCYSFSHIEENNSLMESTISVIGKRATDPDQICPDVMVYLNGYQYKVKATNQGTFYLKIIQPDNSILIDSVIVK